MNQQGEVMETQETEVARKERLAKKAAKAREWRAAKKAAIEKVKAAPAANKKTTKTKGPVGPATDERLIKLLITENPKRHGSAAHALYAKYQDGMTVDQYIFNGGTLAALRWDARHKFIAVK
jgi:hypothetical protein